MQFNFIPLSKGSKGQAIAGTGHRPDKLGGYELYENHTIPELTEIARTAIRVLQPTQIISGMALGWDTCLARAALLEGIPLIAAVPGRWFPDRWSERQRWRYGAILERATQVVYVDELPEYTLPIEGYSPQKLSKRNEYMSEHSNLMLALWNGTPGGTFNNLEYAQSKGMQMINLWDRWQQVA